MSKWDLSVLSAYGRSGLLLPLILLWWEFPQGPQIRGCGFSSLFDYGQQKVRKLPKLQGPDLSAHSELNYRLHVVPVSKCHCHVVLFPVVNQQSLVLSSRVRGISHSERRNNSNRSLRHGPM